MAPPVNGSTHLIPAYYSIYRPRKDETLSWPSWLNYSGWLTHISGHPSAAGRAQDRESSPARDRRSTNCATPPTSPISSTYCTKLYPQNGDRIVTIDSVTSCHPVYMRVRVNPAKDDVRRTSPKAQPRIKGEMTVNSLRSTD